MDISIETLTKMTTSLCYLCLGRFMISTFLKDPICIELTDE